MHQKKIYLLLVLIIEIQRYLGGNYSVTSVTSDYSGS